MNPSTHSTNIGIELLSPKFVLVPKALTEIYSVVQEFLPPPDQNKEDAQENGKKLTTNGDAERKVEQNQLVLPVHSNGDKANTPHSTQQDSILKVKINIRNSFQIHFLKLLAKVCYFFL